MTSSWNGALNQILFGLIYTDNLTDEIVRWTADSAVNYTTLSLGPEAYQRAIREALASGQKLDGIDQVPQFGQEQLSHFLRALDERIEALRPWPEPDFREIAPPEAWNYLRDASLVAVVRSPLLKLYNAFRTSFERVSTDPRHEALVLRLKSGDIIAVSVTFEPQETISLLAGRDSDPAKIIDEFLRLTGLPREKVIPV
jgi:hypothetical protein